MEEIIGPSVLILGYGKEGKAVHRYLLKRHPKKKIAIADRKKIKPAVNLPAELYSGKNYLKSLRFYDLIIRSPGIPSSLPPLQKALKNGKKITSATNIFFSKCPGLTIGVTGTKGKSTTSSLIFNILKEKYPDVRLAGNIGRPALASLFGSTKKTIFVIELSSFQLEDIRYSPKIVVLLDIVPEHLDRYKNFRKYLAAKARVFKQQTAGNIVIFNPDRKTAAQLAGISPAQKYRFALKPKKNVYCYLEKNSVFLRKRKGGKPQFALSRDKLPLLGKGNLENVLAAVSTGALLDVPIPKIRQAVLKFKPLPHRLEFIGKYRGIKFYNDSLATIPEAAINALTALGNKVETLIAGGFDRGLDYTKLGKFLRKKRGLKTLILFPDTGEKISKAVFQKDAQNKTSPLKEYRVSSMEEAVKIAFAQTAPGKICLLSPAAASFNLFRSYKERGDLFKKLVSKFK